jgi:hypothetical protein
MYNAHVCGHTADPDIYLLVSMDINLIFSRLSRIKLVIWIRIRIHIRNEEIGIRK